MEFFYFNVIASKVLLEQIDLYGREFISWHWHGESGWPDLALDKFGRLPSTLSQHIARPATLPHFLASSNSVVVIFASFFLLPRHYEALSQAS